MRIEVDTDVDSLEELKQAVADIQKAIDEKQPSDSSSGFMNIFDMPLGSAASTESSASQSDPQTSVQPEMPSIANQEVPSQSEDKEEEPKITIIDY